MHTFHSIDLVFFFLSEVICGENVLTKVITLIISSVFTSDSIPTQLPPPPQHVTHPKLLICLFWSPKLFFSSIFLFLYPHPSIFLDSNGSNISPLRKR